MTRVTRIALCLLFPFTLAGAAELSESVQPGELPPEIVQAPPLTATAAESRGTPGLSATEAGPAPAETAAGITAPASAAGPVEAQRHAEIVVTASRIPRDVAETPDSVSIAGADDIRTNNARDLGEMVERLPGVEVAPYGGPGSNANISVRGSRANQVLVMQDGRPLNQVSSGEADASQVMAGGVDRVEVLRGPSGLLYGSSSVGGVVNVITPRAPEEFSGLVEAQGGTFDTRVRRERAGGPFLFGRWLVEHDGVQSDGHRRNSAFRGDSFLVKGEIVQRPRITVTGGAARTIAGVPGARPAALPNDPLDMNFYSFASNPFRRSANDEQFGDGEVASLIDEQANWNRYLDTRVDIRTFGEHELALHHYTEFSRLSYTFGSYWGFGNPEINATHLHADLQGAEAQYTVRPWLSAGHLTVGGAWRKERLRSTEDSYDAATGGSTAAENLRARVESGAEFVEASVRPLSRLADAVGAGWVDMLTVAGGARHDRHAAFGDVMNPHAGVVVDLGRVVPGPDVLAVKASHGTAYRAPSLNDLYWPDSMFSGGNPDLRPERGRVTEGGIEGRGARFSGRVAGFSRKIRDQIDWSPDSSGKWQPRNVGEVRTVGAEVEAAYRYRWVRISGNFTAIDAKQRQSEVVEYDLMGVPLATETRERFAAHVPTCTAGAVVSADLPTGTGLSLAVRGSGRRLMYIEDSYSATPSASFMSYYVEMATKRLDPFAVATLRVSQKVLGKAELYAGIENLMDEEYASRFGNSLGDRNYPAPPRTYFAGMSAAW